VSSFEPCAIRATTPQDAAGQKAPDRTIADFETWVRQGAIWPATAWKKTVAADKQHWAFQPVKKSQPPVDPTGWAGNPIELLHWCGIAQHDLSRPESCGERALLRRLCTST